MSNLDFLTFPSFFLASVCLSLILPVDLPLLSSSFLSLSLFVFCGFSHLRSVASRLMLQRFDLYLCLRQACLEPCSLASSLAALHCLSVLYLCFSFCFTWHPLPVFVAPPLTLRSASLSFLYFSAFFSFLNFSSFCLSCLCSSLSFSVFVVRPLLSQGWTEN